MIFISLGTQKFQFNRLLKLVDDLKEEGLIKEEIFAQVGNSDYKPRNYQYLDFLSNEEFTKKMEEASLIISHSGVGTILKAINKDKPIIVAPRLAKLKEHVDDHQIEIAKAFSKKNFCFIYEEGDDLVSLINKAKTHKFDKYVSSKDKVIARLEDYLARLEESL